MKKMEEVDKSILLSLLLDLFVEEGKEVPSMLR